VESWLHHTAQAPAAPRGFSGPPSPARFINAAVDAEGRVLLARLDDPTRVFPRAFPLHRLSAAEHRPPRLVRVFDAAVHLQKGYCGGRWKVFPRLRLVSGGNDTAGALIGEGIRLMALTDGNCDGDWSLWTCAGKPRDGAGGVVARPGRAGLPMTSGCLVSSATFFSVERWSCALSCLIAGSCDALRAGFAGPP
jgi:hypothetical protein